MKTITTAKILDSGEWDMVHTFDIIKCNVVCVVGAGSPERQKKKYGNSTRGANLEKE